MEAERSSRATSVVVVNGQGLDWCFDVEHVREIVREQEWRGDPPIDLSSAWGVPLEAGSQSERVLVVQSQAGALGVRAARVSYRTIAGGQILPLPRFVAGRWARSGIVGIVFPDAPPLTSSEARNAPVLVAPPTRSEARTAPALSAPVPLVVLGAEGLAHLQKIAHANTPSFDKALG